MAHFSGQPPYSNTGVVNTWPSHLVATPDWVSCTFRFAGELQELLPVLGFNFDDFVSLKSGSFGYLNGVYFEHIAFYWGTPEGASPMGVHMVISGQGCRFLEQFDGFEWLSWLGLLRSLSARFTRFDVAVDDYKGRLSLSRLYRSVGAGEVVSRFKTARQITSNNLSDGSSTGRTIYFGSSTSDLQFRFYDKRAERLAKGFEQVPDVYNRYEIQFSRDRACSAVDWFLDHDDLYALVFGVLSNNISVRVRSADSNRSRWPVASYWSKFLDDCRQVKLYKPRASLSIPRKVDWLGRQTSKSIRMVSEALADDKFLFDYIRACGLKKDLKPADLALVADFKRDDNRDLLVDSMFKVMDSTRLAFMDAQKKRQRFLNQSADDVAESAIKISN